MRANPAMVPRDHHDDCARTGPWLRMTMAENRATITKVSRDDSDVPEGISLCSRTHAYKLAHEPKRTCPRSTPQSRGMITTSARSHGVGHRGPCAHSHASAASFVHHPCPHYGGAPSHSRGRKPHSQPVDAHGRAIPIWRSRVVCLVVGPEHDDGFPRAPPGRRAASGQCREKTA